MYAIVEIAGQQFKVEKDQKVFVHRLKEDEGKKVAFDNVLLLGDGEKFTIGAPAIDGAQVGAKVLRHLKGDTLTEIQIEKILAAGAKKATKAKAEPKPKAKPEPKVEAKKAAPAKKAEPKKAAAKPAAKKTTSKAKADDLKKIEGIGPKIASTLVDGGIVTFADLAKAKPAEISEIIAGVRGNHVPDTWPEQAKLAADGKWDELKALQDKLDGGKK